MSIPINSLPGRKIIRNYKRRESCWCLMGCPDGIPIPDANRIILRTPDATREIPTAMKIERFVS